ncbi:MAG: tetratricopeptide repeat protein, partial [Bacteroidales bacterium]
MKTKHKVECLIILLLCMSGKVFAQADTTENDQIVVPAKVVVDTTKSDSVVAAEGQEAQLEYNAGVDYMKAERYQQAINKFNEALSVNPDFEQAYLNRGSAYFQSNQLDKAKKDLVKATELNADLESAY